MLPKVANQILHHTSRAVAAVQNQTGQTIRNVLQLQSSSGPSSAAGNLGAWNSSGSSSSGWGNGPGAGGAKHQSGSRFHSSYSTVGRAATLVDPSLTQAANADSFDDPDESWQVAPLRTKHRRRSRSSSLSFSVQDKDEQLARIGVLKTVQLHVRARHAFAAPPSLPGFSPETPADPEEITPNEPLSTSDEQALDVRIKAEEQAFRAIHRAKQSKDTSQVLAEIKKLRDVVPAPTAAVWNAALQALVDLRKPNESIQLILSTYHEMISRSVLPNFRTYITLMEALSERDIEISDEIERVSLRMRMRLASEGAVPPNFYEKQLEELKAENAFGAALTLFQAACLIPHAKIPLPTYMSLLRCCAEHGNVDAAIHVFAHAEKRSDLKLPPSIYKNLIRAYRIGGDLQGAKEVFKEYKEVVQQGKVWVADEQELNGVPLWRLGHIQVWTELLATYFHFKQPAAALELLEEMMDTPKGLDFEVTDPPLPSSATFSEVIRGFIRSGDIPTGLAWFDKLLAQQDKPPAMLYQPVLNPTQPDANAWSDIIEALLAKDMFDDLTRVLHIAGNRSAELSDFLCITLVRAYIHRLSAQGTSVGEGEVATLDLLRKLAHKALPSFVLKKRANGANSDWLHYTLIALYLNCGRPDRAIDVAEELVATVKGGLVGDLTDDELKALKLKMMSPRRLVDAVGPRIVKLSTSPYWSLRDSMRLLALYGQVFSDAPYEICEEVLECYRKSSVAERGKLTIANWQQLLQANKRLLVPLSFEGNTPSPVALPMLQMLAELQAHRVLRRIPHQTITNMTQLMSPSEIGDFLANLGEDEVWARSLRGSLTRSKWSPQPVSEPTVDVGLPPSSSHTPVRIDLQLSRHIEQYYPTHPKVTPLMAFDRFQAGVRKGQYPTPEVMSKLINSLGRLGELEKVRTLYNASQVVLSALEENKQWQSTGWFGIEDAMIIALAHAGDTDGAHVHRARILEQGGSPSADAYGALIQCVKDTTDDTSNAMALFQEALTRGVAPNIYLYNTAISKLAKARKADHALSLFQEMKARGIAPTSVTYGAVIAACCRVGDAQSAEVLFQEMASQPNFKPRVPPYNTMMQLHTHTKPDRERVLFYYNALLAANVRPTAHTYKLLIDAFGTIEPVDTDSMVEIFEKLIADPNVPVQGTHWAALINAWGCVRKDLNKAVEIFESIRDHPSTRHSRAMFPDAVIFEALINVLVTLRRADLLPIYTAKMSTYGVHMTAYIANLLIKGFAASGDIARAREIFEGLSDPPEGVAAPNNHAPHDSEVVAPNAVPASAPVYREPSTWEAMVRAELGNGNREQAVALLERVQARRFPAAVYNRISGIMLDDAVSPWAPTPDSTISDSLSS